MYSYITFLLSLFSDTEQHSNDFLGAIYSW